MPTYFETVLNTTITSIYPYPPPIIIKHHFWYFPDSDFFITICSIVYGLHRRHFESSSFFSAILNQNKPGHDIPRGTTVYLPIPFDDLSPDKFFAFLHHLYYPALFVGTEEEWKDVRRLSLEWDLPRVVGFAALRLLEIRQQQLPPVMQQLVERTTLLGLYRRVQRRNHLYEVQVEDDEEERNIHRG